MRKVPRHEFIPEPFRLDAYGDHPLPIGEGQTISQPYIVAAMLEHLALEATDRVLEVGTGSGYVTALLSLLSAEVYSVERHAPLALSAESMLRRLEYRNVKIRVGDGTQGWAEYAPFDAILVSAATAVRSVARRRTHDGAGRPALQPGIAIDLQSQRRARGKDSRRLPVCAVGGRSSGQWLVVSGQLLVMPCAGGFSGHWPLTTDHSPPTAVLQLNRGLAPKS
jgi:protein-L-isoaspartate(D-aspartate) O-methyltransferase